MDVKWLSNKSFVVKGTTYTVQVPVTLEEEVQTALSEIKKKKGVL